MRLVGVRLVCVRLVGVWLVCVSLVRVRLVCVLARLASVFPAPLSPEMRMF